VQIKRRQQGDRLAVWGREGFGDPIACPLPEVAERLGQPLALVQAAAQQVEPYIRLDGRPVWSIHLGAVALGLRRSRVERTRKKNQTDARWCEQHRQAG
jgi:hypothetical protein